MACGRFFELILRSSATPVGLLPALRAYLVSHLGKYVPGKAMVVIVRAGMVVPFGARASTAAIATFYETLVMMASGGLIAAAGFATATGSGGSALVHVTYPSGARSTFPLYRLAAFAGLGLGLVFVCLTVPPVFRPAGGTGQPADPRCRSGGNASLYGPADGSGSALVVVRLDLAGAEPGRGRACVRSEPGADSLIAFGLVPVVIASVALATVAGFLVAVLPGGLGVREGVLMSALAPAIGSDQAVIASLDVAAGLGGGRAGRARQSSYPWFDVQPDSMANSPRASRPGSHDQRRRSGS